MRAALGALLAALVIPFAASGAGKPAQHTIFVNSLADAPSTSSCTLREAIVNANNDDVSGSTTCSAGAGVDRIVIQRKGTIALTGPLPDIAGPTAIVGVRNVTLRGGAFRILRASNTLTLANLTFRGGNASYAGALLVDAGVSVSIDDTAFADNHATGCDCGPDGQGGAIYADSGSQLTIDQSTFSDNSAERGGAIRIQAGSTADITRSAFRQNHAFVVSGGLDSQDSDLTLVRDRFNGNSSDYIVGAFQIGGSSTVTDTLVSGNEADWFVGGVAVGLFGTQHVVLDRVSIVGNTTGCQDGGLQLYGSTTNTLTVLDTTIAGNSVTGAACFPAQAGGVAVHDGNLVLANSTVAGNRAVDDVGGIEVDEGVGTGGALTLVNSTVVGNYAGSGNGGLHVANDGSSASLGNSIVALNRQLPGDAYSDCAGVAPTSNGHNLASDATCNLGAGGDVTGADPLLRPLTPAAGVQIMAPKHGSPVVDAGSDAMCAAAPVSGHDQRGHARPHGVHCDIGAVEK